MQKFAHLTVCVCACVGCAFDRSIDVNHLNLWTTCCTGSSEHNTHTHTLFGYLFADTNAHQHTCAYVNHVPVCHKYVYLVHTYKHTQTNGKKLIVSIEKSIILGQFQQQCQWIGSNGFLFCFAATNAFVLHFWTILEWTFCDVDVDAGVSAWFLNV